MALNFSFPNVPTKADYLASAVSGSTIPILNKPDLKTVATTGAYTDLTGRPTLSTVATSGAYTDLSGKPVLATVATSGAYNDLTAKPTLASATTPAATANTWVTFLSNASSATVSNDTQNFAGASVGRYVQAWYFAAAPVSVAAGDISVTLNNTGSFVRSWEYVDPSLGFIPGNVATAGNADQTIPSQHYAGFIDLATPTFSGSLNYDIAANSFKTLNCVAFTLPAGWNEFRLYYQGNPGYFFVQNSLSFNNLYASPIVATPVGRTLSAFTGQFRDVQARRMVTRNVNVTNSLRVNGPNVWRWVFATNLALTVNTTTTPPSSAWTLQNPTGSANVMNTNGSISVPATGIYTLVIQAYLGGSVSGAQTLSVVSSDAALQGIIWLNQASGTGATWGGSWTGRLVAQTTLTPQFTSGQTSPTLIGASGDARMFTHIGLNQIYTCM